jgi:hypothetical protein
MRVTERVKNEKRREKRNRKGYMKSRENAHSKREGKKISIMDIDTFNHSGGPIR